MKIVVVIPTYNEAQNIGRMIEALDGVFKQIPNHEMHLLVVDDTSPDGTGDVVKKQQEKYSWVHLLTKDKKEGLGAAYFYGFKHAMSDLGADVVVEMDADFQHDPKDLPRLIAPLDEGYDYVIGSRFMEGGSIPKEWEFHRRLVSWLGNIFTKVVLGIYTVDDFTTGFKASRVKGFMDQLSFDEINKGFSYKMDILYKMRKLGAKIKQIPIKFGVRDRGVSKIEGATFFDSLFLVIKLRALEKKEFVKFCIVGGAGFITDTTLFNVLNLFTTHPKVSAILSGLVAMTVTFILNNAWSFGSRKKNQLGEQLKSFPFYAGSSLVPIVIRSQMVALSITWFGHNFYVYNAAFLLGVFFGLIWNYIVYSRIVWKRK